MADQHRPHCRLSARGVSTGTGFSAHGPVVEAKDAGIPWAGGMPLCVGTDLAKSPQGMVGAGSPALAPSGEAVPARWAGSRSLGGPGLMQVLGLPASAAGVFSGSRGDLPMDSSRARGDSNAFGSQKATQKKPADVQGVSRCRGGERRGRAGVTEGAVDAEDVIPAQGPDDGGRRQQGGNCARLRARVAGGQGS